MIYILFNFKTNFIRTTNDQVLMYRLIFEQYILFGEDVIAEFNISSTNMFHWSLGIVIVLVIVPHNN